MLRLMNEFTRAMLGSLAKPWRLWLALLVAANMIAPLFFIGTIEGIAVLVTFVVSAILQMMIFRSKGYVRLLGAGHAPWVVLLAWLAPRIPETPAATVFGIWIVAVVVVDGLSLTIDAIDVARYIGGDRKPTYRFGVTGRV